MHGSAPLVCIAFASPFFSAPFALTHTLRFADSDTLWAGLVRGIYAKVEQRIDYESEKGGLRKWRVKRAKRQLVERFGLVHIRWVAAYTAVLMLALVALIVVEATGYTHAFTAIYSSIVSSIDAAIGVLVGLVTAVAAVVPSFKLAFASNKESNMSRGEAIFKEASTVRDQLGFLAKVKVELQELFDFLHEFDSRIVIVITIDDLDRCLTDGRNVRVLEAMQLILSVPGAPIISFLAVDSRIVVASIEEHYEKVFTKTNISGHEYLDKIVQLPFAMPEPPPEKVERLLSKALEGDAASLVQVAKRLKIFGKFSRNILGHAGSTLVTFKLTPTRDDPLGAVVDLEPLVNEIDKFKGDDAEDTLELVCAAARKLGPYLTTLADRFIQPLGPDERVMHGFEEEAVEVLCRATNTALELGKLGFGEVAAVEKAGANVAVENTAAEKAEEVTATEAAAVRETLAAEAVTRAPLVKPMSKRGHPPATNFVPHRIPLPELPFCKHGRHSSTPRSQA